MRKTPCREIIKWAYLASNGDSINAMQDKLNKELEVMRNNKKVKRVNITDQGELEIYTETIFANVLGRDNVLRKYRFGEYRVVINVGDGDVKFLNVNQKDKKHGYWGEGCHHPHVNKNGTPCLGSASTLIMDCIDRYQWGVLIDVLVSYLESVNTDDSAGKRYYKWEQLDKDGKIVESKYDPEY